MVYLYLYAVVRGEVAGHEQPLAGVVPQQQEVHPGRGEEGQAEGGVQQRVDHAAEEVLLLVWGGGSKEKELWTS